MREFKHIGILPLFAAVFAWVFAWAVPLASAATTTWGQWLGGSSIDEVLALAVNNDEIYAGGYALSAATWGESITWQGSYSGSYEGFVIEIADTTTPSIVWGQWLGGSSFDYVQALAVNNDEIYAGGYSYNATNWGESITWQGSFSGSFEEGFVVEIADGTTPSIAWGQWLGGSDNDQVRALAVIGDEIYAGGYSFSDEPTWEASINWRGTFSGGEGFVIEIADGANPSIEWGQWLGGANSDSVRALAVTGDEIYAGGIAGADATTWDESITWQGSHGGSNEGFVVEIADGANPSIEWGQWLGGSSEDSVWALAVTNDEIYVGGSAGNAATWGESVTWQGSYSGSTEGFVIEIADGTTPSIAWGQWLGGSSIDYVWALAVNNDELYAGGYTDNATNWESITWQGSFSNASGTNEGFVVEIADATTPSIAWGQWLGGSGSDEVKALAVNNDEIYAGGYATTDSTTFGESITWQGSFSNGSGIYEGFVVEIDDAATGGGGAEAIKSTLGGNVRLSGTVVIP